MMVVIETLICDDICIMWDCKLFNWLIFAYWCVWCCMKYVTCIKWLISDVNIRKWLISNVNIHWEITVLFSSYKWRLCSMSGEYMWCVECWLDDLTATPKQWHELWLYLKKVCHFHLAIKHGCVLFAKITYLFRS